MSKIAYIFPGQGSQYVGMGKDLFDHHPAAKQRYAMADGILGFPISSLSFEGPETELRQTKNTQPAIFVHSMALVAIQGSTEASMTAGHSLGEYSALVYAGAMSFEDGLRLVRLRAEAMQRAGEEQQGTMAAIVGLDPKAVGELCCQAYTEGIVQSANFNSPGQIVISGSIPGVRKAMELAKARGAKLVKELVVSGAFHSPLMEHARNSLREALNHVTIHDTTIPVYTNVTAKPVTSAGEIRRLLEEQLTSPVRWEETIENMIADGATSFCEIGPGKVLQGLVRRIAGTVEVRGMEKMSDIEKAATA